MLAALATRLPGDFMQMRSSSSQGLAQVPCIPCIILQVVLNDAFLLILQVKKGKRPAQARSTTPVKFKLMPSSNCCQVQIDVKCSASNLYCKLLLCGASRRRRTTRRRRRSRGVTLTGALSRLCQTPAGSVILCCSTARQHVLLPCSYPMVLHVLT